MDARKEVTPRVCYHALDKRVSGTAGWRRDVETVSKRESCGESRAAPLAATAGAWTAFQAEMKWHRERTGV